MKITLELGIRSTHLMGYHTPNRSPESIPISLLFRLSEDPRRACFRVLHLILDIGANREDCYIQHNAVKTQYKRNVKGKRDVPFSRLHPFTLCHSNPQPRSLVPVVVYERGRRRAVTSGPTLCPGATGGTPYLLPSICLPSITVSI